MISSLLRHISKLCLIVIFLTSCDRDSSDHNGIFTKRPPNSKELKAEVQYLALIKKLTKSEITFIETQLDKVQDTLGVPKALLWCVLFQESRFDPFMNAFTDAPAKGIGQFTGSALDEINFDTDIYDSRTSAILQAQLKPKNLPLDFTIKTSPLNRMPGSIEKRLPPQPLTSYFRASTAIFASGAYLNNRYQQLKSALDHQGISYDPQILWLYAAAAYNKGSRTVFLLLTHEYMSHGEGALRDLLSDPKAAYSLLTHQKRLDLTLKEIWTKKTRTKYIDELLRNMEVISSCSLSST